MPAEDIARLKTRAKGDTFYVEVGDLVSVALVSAAAIDGALRLVMPHLADGVLDTVPLIEGTPAERIVALLPSLFRPVRLRKGFGYIGVTKSGRTYEAKAYATLSKAMDETLLALGEVLGKRLSKDERRVLEEARKRIRKTAGKG